MRIAIFAAAKMARCFAAAKQRSPTHPESAWLQTHPQKKVILLMKYGSSELCGKFVLAPMAGYTDIAFRLLCREYGAAMCFTEFANAEAIIRGGKNTDALLATCKKEMPVGIQVFGGNQESMGKASGIVSSRVETGELSASCIDINFGCPANSVVRAGAGSALLRKPEKMRAIAAACVKASSLPVTAKIRVGWGKDDGVAFAKMLEQEGIAGITVHWRTATEGRKRADAWGVVKEIKQALSIPVIGNGGASTPERAVRFLSETCCDAVMIATGALGNPLIFREANGLFDKGQCRQSSWEERREAFAKYLKLAKRHGVASPKRLRAHAIEWVSGFPGVKEARKKLNAAKTEGEIEGVIMGFSTPAHLT